MKSELQHSSGASRASFGLEMLVLQALVYRSAFQGSSDTLGSQGMDPSACCSCLLPWNNQFSSPGSLMVDKQCLVGGKTGLFTWLEVCDHGQGHCLSAGVTSKLSQ